MKLKGEELNAFNQKNNKRQQEIFKLNQRLGLVAEGTTSQSLPNGYGKPQSGNIYFSALPRKDEFETMVMHAVDQYKKKNVAETKKDKNSKKKSKKSKKVETTPE